MHASLFVSLALFGASIVPEPDILTIPLKEDLSGRNSIQDLEWQERVKSKPLPRAPTLDNGPMLRDDPRNPNSSYRTPQPATSPYAPHGNAPVMPQAPTQEGAGPSGAYNQPGGGYGGQGGGYRPASFGQPGGYGQAAQPGAGMAGNNFGGNYAQQNRIAGGGFVAPGIQGTPQALSVNNLVNNSSYNLNQMEAQFGVAPTSTMQSAGNSNKAFSGYTAPSGASAWNNLYLPTSNGTQNTYTNYVQPAMNQQNFNSHISEQINGVQMLQRGYGGTSGGTEINMGGSGLANPNGFINYANPMH